MGNFPAGLLPTGRTFIAGDYPHTAHKVLTGKEVRIRHSNTASGARLRVSLALLTTAELYSIRDHFAGQLGGFQPFSVPDDLLLGTTAPANFTPAEHVWRYIGVKVEDVPIDSGAPLNRHNVELEFECSPPDSVVAGGFRLQATAAWSPGHAMRVTEFLATATWLPGIAGAIPDGFTLTATAAWSPGRGPIPGAVWTATALWEPGEPQPPPVVLHGGVYLFPVEALYLFEPD